MAEALRRYAEGFVQQARLLGAGDDEVRTVIEAALRSSGG